MSIELREAAVTGPRSAPLPPTSLLAPDATVTTIAVDTDERPMLLSLLIAGRVKPSSGRVLIDGVEDARALRRRVAVVDTPFTSEPHPALPLRTLVAEELGFAGRPSRAADVHHELARLGLPDTARMPVRELGTTDRIRLLAELALARERIDTLVITSPERHGGDPVELAALFAGFAVRGVTVIVVTDAATDAALRAALPDAVAAAQSAAESAATASAAESAAAASDSTTPHLKEQP